MHRVCLLAVALTTTAFAGDTHITQQGRLLDSVGEPIQGSHSVTVTLYDQVSEGDDLWQRTYENVPFSGGYYAIPLEGGDDTESPRELDGAVSASDVWVGIAVDGNDELEPRQRLPSNVGPTLPRWGYSINSSASNSHCTVTSNTPTKCAEADWPPVELASRSGNFKVTFTGNIYGGSNWAGTELFVNDAWYGTGGHGNWHYGSNSSYTWNAITVVWIVTGLEPNVTHKFNMGLRCNGGTCQIHHNSGNNSAGYGGKLLVEELG